MSKYISWIGAAIFGIVCAICGVVFITPKGAAIFGAAVLWVWLTKMGEAMKIEGWDAKQWLEANYERYEEQRWITAIGERHSLTQVMEAFAGYKIHELRLNAGEPCKPRCPKCKSDNTQGVGGFECSDCGTEFITHEFFPAERQEGWVSKVAHDLVEWQMATGKFLKAENPIYGKGPLIPQHAIEEALRIYALPATPSAPGTSKDDGA